MPMSDVIIIDKINLTSPKGDKMDRFIVDDIFDQRTPDLWIYDNAVTTQGNSKIVSKKGLEKVIEHLIDYYNNYDEYFYPLLEEKKKKDDEINTVSSVDRVKDKSGFVYIMKNMGYYKIGKCSRDKTRLGEYTKLPEEPEYPLMMYVFDNSYVENKLHDMFSDKRLRNGMCEWFSLTEKDIEKATAYAFQYIIPMP